MEEDSFFDQFGYRSQFSTMDDMQEAGIGAGDIEAELNAQPLAGYMPGHSAVPQETSTPYEPRATFNTWDIDLSPDQQFHDNVGTHYALSAGSIDVNLRGTIPTPSVHSTPYDRIHGMVNLHQSQARPTQAFMLPPTTSLRPPNATRDSGYVSRTINHDAYSYDRGSSRSLYRDDSHLGAASIPDTATVLSDDSMSQQAGQDQSARSATVGQQRCSWVDCGKVFPNSSSLKKHIASHKKAFNCSVVGCPRHIAGQGFANDNDRQRHLQTAHHINLKEVYFCAWQGCNVFNPRKDNFTDHLLRVHKIEKGSEQCIRLCKDSVKPWASVAQVDRELLSMPRDKRRNEKSEMSSSSGQKRRQTSRPVVEDSPTATKRSRVDKQEPPDEASLGPSMRASTDLPMPHEAAEQTQQAGGQFDQLSVASYPHLEPIPSMQESPLLPFPPHLFPEDQQHWAESQQPHLQWMAPHMAQDNPAYFTEQYQSLEHHHHGQHARVSQDETLDMSHAYPAFVRRQFTSSQVPQIRDSIPSGEPAPAEPQIDIVSQVSHTLGQHQQLTSLTIRRTYPIVPNFPQQAHSLPSRLVGRGSPAYSVVEYEQYSEADVTESGVGNGSYRCPFEGCGKIFPQQSKLSKHTARHDRPFKCMWDDCCHNRNAQHQKNVSNPESSNGLGWYSSGSKSDLMRHEDSVHVKTAEVLDCFRCTKSNMHYMEDGQMCQQLFTSSAESYATHLRACIAPAIDLENAVWQAFIPANFNGRFWCGFCDDIVDNKTPSDVGTQSLEKQQKTRLEERHGHIRDHYRGSNPPQMGSWKYLNAEGRTKFEVDLERTAMLQTRVQMQRRSQEQQ
ncbi:uncharacterized protein AB675_2651 [Cyphellophora attinorum]|uniref:C2H2-type domain-containing protein n=1 Tax=Cyphellophora attinorum TaxID=1664694 RepID=A0A0N1HWX5_9EURO|nr:uncharacterized protein AB675_2651 [Phialophora attinorum]KPI44872.1 hypothetical protein AB675_2651 [Phialophora attinorum]